MDIIGLQLKETRENAGVSIKEASKDLDIKEEFLLNIEDGKIGCFKDIFELKNYISSYAKYLGLDSNILIDKFNEYLFDYTSKIPIKEIEAKAKKEQKNETKKVTSPYTRKSRKYSRISYIAIYILIVILVLFAILWSVKQITVDSRVTDTISYWR